MVEYPDYPFVDTPFHEKSQVSNLLPFPGDVALGDSTNSIYVTSEILYGVRTEEVLLPQLGLEIIQHDIIMLGRGWHVPVRGDQGTRPIRADPKTVCQALHDSFGELRFRVAAQGCCPCKYPVGLGSLRG